MEELALSAFWWTLVRSNTCNSYNILPPETAVKTEGFTPPKSNIDSKK